MCGSAMEIRRRHIVSSREIRIRCVDTDQALRYRAVIRRAEVGGYVHLRSNCPKCYGRRYEGVYENGNPRMCQCVRVKNQKELVRLITEEFA